jgi:HPt (histidine-containing phosphotransfer) domain-containing protein
MRGSSGTLGMARLHQLAERVEAAAEAGEVAPGLLQALRQTVGDSESALRGRGLL